jgi:magnesium chelatase family protein
MFARTAGAALDGVDARLVEVEVHLGGGLPTVTAVGLPDTSVREGLDRVRVALGSAGFRMPATRAVINLAPAEIPKQGAGLDLPIAVALLVSDGQLPAPGPPGTVLAGELALDGTVRPVRGALAIALAARARGRPRLLVPRESAAEAGLVDDLEVVPVDTLADVAAVAHGTHLERARTDAARVLREAERDPRGVPDLADVRGQPLARRALEVAAAGGHHLLLTGPPGSGKSMLARRMPGILPVLSVGEALDVTRIWSATGRTRGLCTRRPFRAPHHGVSAAALIGGGARPAPGEVTLASRGVLFLDELPEFRRDALEALRQPLEDGFVTIRRVRGTSTFPARFALVAAMNPCPCGHHGSPDGRCTCSPREVHRYLAKLSGPLLDRFDLVVDVPPVDVEALGRDADGEPSTVVRERVERARSRQAARERRGGPTTNAELDSEGLSRWAALDATARSLLVAASRRLGLSARGYDRARRVARTLADLDARDHIDAADVAEAVQFRAFLDRSLAGAEGLS